MQNDYTDVPYPIIESTEAKINRTPELNLLEISDEQLKKSSVLEIGSGSGRIAVKMLRKCASYIGIEKSSSMLLACMNKLSRFKQYNEMSKRFLQGDFLEVDFHEQKYDIIISTDFVICYQKTYPQIFRFLEKIKSVCSKDGTILFDIPIRERRIKEDAIQNVNYNSILDGSIIEINRSFKKNNSNCYTFFYEATYSKYIDLSVKYHWQLDFFYPKRRFILEILGTLFQDSQINEITIENDSMASRFFIIKL